MIMGMKFDPHDPRSSKRASVGRILPGFTVVVLDEAGAERPLGAEGLLAIDVARSPLFWFRAYFKDDANTQAKFRFGPNYFLLGDAGFIDGEGAVHYSGQASHAISMQKD